jgi:hypothetical protein
VSKLTSFSQRRNNKYPFYLGIDLHLKRTYLVLMNQAGEIIDEQRLGNAEVVDYLKEKVSQRTYAVMKATRNWPFMYDFLCDYVERVELAHPKKVKAISPMRRSKLTGSMQVSWPIWPG